MESERTKELRRQLEASIAEDRLRFENNLNLYKAPDSEMSFGDFKEKWLRQLHRVNELDAELKVAGFVHDLELMIKTVANDGGQFQVMKGS